MLLAHMRQRDCMLQATPAHLLALHELICFAPSKPKMQHASCLKPLARKITIAGIKAGHHTVATLI